MRERTTYLLFVDESGDHDMSRVDPKWPVFVLVGLLVGERHYQQVLTKRVAALKKKHGLAPDVPLHSHKIRRWEGPFEFLNDRQKREEFCQDLDELISGLRIRVYAIVIDKEKLASRFLLRLNPYTVSLSQLLSLTCGTPGSSNPYRPQISRIIAESRGRLEDSQLQDEYQNYRKRGFFSYGSSGVSDRMPKTVQRLFPSRIVFQKKRKCLAGLELADLIAYPIARSYVNKDWSNPAYAVVSRKMRQMLPFP